MTGENPTPCAIAHRTTAAARRCDGYHPGLTPVPVFGDLHPAEPGCIVMPGDPRYVERPSEAAEAAPPADVAPDPTPPGTIVGVDTGAGESWTAESRAPGEPDEPKRAAAADATSPHGPKEAIWKSVIGATGGWGCERETFYREVVRDARGYRLRTGAGERIVFGIAIDVAHGYLMAQRLEHGPVDSSTLGMDISSEGTGEPVTEDMLWSMTGEAVRRGMSSARGRLLEKPWTEDDWTVMTQQVGLAVEKLLGLWPNRVKPRMSKGEVVEWLTEPEPEGTPPGPPIAWLDAPAGIVTRLQHKMHAPDVVGGRGITGQPDYTFWADRTIVGWVDVKAPGKSKSFPATWVAGEAVAYDYMAAVNNEGLVPEWHGYLEYRRTQKPYWAITTAPVDTSVLTLARSYFERWGTALDGDNPDALSFNPKSCSKCSYRDPLPQYGFAGCPIGPAVLDIAPMEDDDADG